MEAKIPNDIKNSTMALQLCFAEFGCKPQTYVHIHTYIQFFFSCFVAGSYICFVTCIFCLVRWVSTPCALKHDGKWTLNFEGVQTWICPLGCSLFWDVRGCNGCPNAKSPWKIGWFIVEPSESCLLIKAIFGVVFPLHKPYIQLLLSLGRRQQCNRPMLHWWHTILFDNSFEAQKFSLLWGKRLFLTRVHVYMPGACRWPQKTQKKPSPTLRTDSQVHRANSGTPCPAFGFRPSMMAMLLGWNRSRKCWHGVISKRMH